MLLDVILKLLNKWFGPKRTRVYLDFDEPPNEGSLSLHTIDSKFYMGQIDRVVFHPFGIMKYPIGVRCQCSKDRYTFSFCRLYISEQMREQLMAACWRLVEVETGFHSTYIHIYRFPWGHSDNGTAWAASIGGGKHASAT
jgi:hypothetical protein